MTTPPSRNRSRIWVLGALLVAMVLGAFVLSRDGRRSAELLVVEGMGEAAMAMLDQAEGNDRAAGFIKTPIEVRELRPNIFQSTGVANTHLISTEAGNVLFDTGLSLQVPKQKRALEAAAPERPITHVIVSHSHADHAGGVRFWAEADSEIIAHQEFPEEQRYLKALEPYLHRRNRTLFPFIPEDPPQIGLIAYGGVEPTRLVRNGEPHRFTLGGVRFEVIATPGAEGADNLVLWLPDEKVLFSGDFFSPLFPQFPNIFTMRGEKVRKPIEYIHSLDLLIALEPELIVPGHKDPIEGRERILAGMVRMRDAVQYVHDATVEGMNAGKSVHELMAEVELPPELELSQVHGRVSWGVKSIWEYYATWFHFDTTTELYPVPASAVYADLAELAGVDAMVTRARAQIDDGRPVHALHLLDVAIGADARNRGALEARRDALRILTEHMEPLDLRRRSLMDEQELAADAPDLEALLRILVEPLVEKLESVSGRAHCMIQAQRKQTDIPMPATKLLSTRIRRAVGGEQSDPFAEEFAFPLLFAALNDRARAVKKRAASATVDRELGDALVQALAGMLRGMASAR